MFNTLAAGIVLA